MKFDRHILILVLLPLILVSAAVSYHRFIVMNDYVVEYEGECDPATESCFEGCEDETCETTYAYKVMQKQASSLRSECGPDISECEDASICLPGDGVCSVEYCDQTQLGEDEFCFVPEEVPEETEENLPEEEPTEETTP